MISREGSVRPHESCRAVRRPLATSAPASTAATSRGMSSGLVLQVAVHRHDDLAARAHEAGVHRGMLAEVALEADGAHPRIVRMDPLELGEGGVGRAVVDEDELVGARPAVERRERPTVELGQSRRLVEERDDDREVGRGELVPVRGLASKRVRVRHLRPRRVLRREPRQKPA